MADAGTVTFNLDANSVRLMRELQKAERGSRRTTQKIRRDFDQMGKRIGVAAAAIVAGTVAIVRAQAQAIDELAKTADALGVTTENLQALQHVAKLTGTSSEQLAKGMERMQRSLGEAARKGGAAADALSDIGLSVDDVLGMSADQQLETLAKALANVEDATIRASIENDLFGRGALRMRKLMNQLATEGLDPVKRELDALGFSINRTEAAGVERMNDSLETANLVSRGFAQRLTIALAPAVATVAEAFIDLAKETKLFGLAGVDATEAVAESLFTLTNRVAALVQVIRILRNVDDAARGALQTAVAPFLDDLNTPGRRLNAVINQMNRLPGVEIEFQFGDVVTGAEEAAQEGVDAIYKAWEQIQEILQEPLPADGLRARFEQIRQDLLSAGQSVVNEDPITLDIDISPAEKSLASLRDQVAIFGLDDIEKELFKLSQVEGMSPQALDDARQMLEWLRDAGVATDEFKQKQSEAAAIITATRTPLEQFNAQIERLNALRDEHVNGEPLIDEETYRRGVEAAQDAFDTATKTVSDIDQFAIQAARNMQSAFAEFLFDPFEDGLKGMLRGFIDTMRKMVAEIAAQAILRSLFSGFAGQEGLLGAMAGALGAKPRAMGGPVSSGSPYLVGERGPELFVPSGSGQIIPNHAMGGSVIVNIDARQSDDPARLLSLVPVIQSQIEQSMELKMRRGYL